MNFRLVNVLINDFIMYQTLIILSFLMRDAAFFMEYMCIVYNLDVPQWDFEAWTALPKWNSIIVWICLFLLNVT